MAISVDDRTVVAELAGLSWTLAEQFYAEWATRRRSTGMLPWGELPATMQESLAEAFQALLAKDVIEVGPALGGR
jgi:hypothetical protein